MLWVPCKTAASTSDESISRPARNPTMTIVSVNAAMWTIGEFVDEVEFLTSECFNVKDSIRLLVNLHFLFSQTDGCVA